ncbi:mitotic-spindle organizing protein 1 isoform X1 [Eublepharis macularius]|uniref:Mitotic-spindle organizing protein 1 isoform X1 n=1 Tax=Eublepharis macularius TaxID=481883 RepID=A0AA97J2K8_EUBMA|nr:mitotic-spindle organizing protein 1 isoform X1 [Eublepharis macularius]
MKSDSSNKEAELLEFDDSPVTLPVLFEISRILNTGLDMETLSICVRLCEQGINPEALSAVIKELRKATEALKAAENMTS